MSTEAVAKAPTEATIAAVAETSAEATAVRQIMIQILERARQFEEEAAALRSDVEQIAHILNIDLPPH